MKYPRIFLLVTLAVLLVGGVSSALGQSNDGPLANVASGGSSVRFDVVAQNAGVTLTVTAPDGRSFTKEFRAGAAPGFDFSERSLPDGNYTYELRLQPSLTPGQKEALARMRGKDDDPEAERAGRKRPVMPNMIQSGGFALVNGQVVVAGLSEQNRTGANVAPGAAKPDSTTRISSGNTAARLKNHRLSLLSSLTPNPDIVHADDVIIQGSLCVGLDCVNNESFGFDTIRLKENNTRIKFDDTSVSAGFPANDWQLTANDSASGGASKFSIEDITGSKVPFTITAGASTNSIFVDSTGRLGLRTSTPVLDVHINTSNTPAIRLEQNNSGGFTAQTWDVAGNEANFFVRDVTGGSKLPFRIRPGAPTSSIDISASGNVGIGTASPAVKLNIATSSDQTIRIDNTTSTNLALMRTSGQFAQFGASNATTVQLVVDDVARMTVLPTSGNVGIGTASPDQKLSVNGDADKAAGGGSWGVFSDERLKDIKGSYTRGLSAVMGLRPLRYSYKKDNALALKSDGEYVGFSAQELQKLVPEAVTMNKDGYLMVHNDAVLWTMLNAIKEQQKEIEQLRGQVKKLQTTSHRRRK